MKGVREFIRSTVEHGTANLYEAKIVIVGAGESGKTTLVKKLLDPNHPVPNTEDKRTEGIAVTEYSFKSKIHDNEKLLTAHIWDFGGQEIYKDTHQIFLSKDTLYILLNDNRKNETDFYYWLNVVTLRVGDTCPVLIVFNEKENSIRRITLNENHFEIFPSLIRTPIDVNFAEKNNSRLQLVFDSVQRYFSELDVLGKTLPKFWVNVRNEIRSIKKDYISFDDFVGICNRNGIPNEDQARIVSQTLHNLGIILHFQNELGLDHLIILNPNWCLDAVYKALDAKIVKDNNGRFQEKNLVEIWSDSKYRNKQSELLKLMRKFNLCYEVHMGKEYIAPQLLPIQENRDPKFPVAETLRYRYEYKFMPRGILTRFIARMSKYIKEPYVWYGGVTLKWGDTTAEIIENPILKEINIKLHGPDKKRRLLEIQDVLAEIHQTFRGLQTTEKIPCNCERCHNKVSPHLFDVEELKDYAEINIPAICRIEKPLKKIAPQQLLDGVFDNFISVSEDVKKWIALGDTDKAVEELQRLRRFRDSGVQFSSRVNNLNEEKLKGTISIQDYNQELAKINDGLLKLVSKKL